MKYMETYSEARIPARKVFNNVTDAVRDINNYIKFSNVSISVWWYKELEQKYEGVGVNRRPTRIGPKWSSAIIDKIFFDIDCLDNKGNILYDRIQGMHKLWSWAQDHDYNRSVCFTGGGFQVLIKADVNYQNYDGCYNHLKNRFGIIDKEYATFEKMRRVPGSFNYGKVKKSERNKYCISLEDNELYDDFEHLIEVSNKQRFGLKKFGEESFTTNRVYKTNEKRKLDRRTDFTYNNSLNDIFSSYGFSYNDICPSIRNIIEQPHVGHFERLDVIKYLKTIFHIKYADMVIILPKLMTAGHNNITDGEHSVMEHQPDSIYSNNAIFNARVMRKKGYCDQECRKCDKYVKWLLGYE